MTKVIENLSDISDRFDAIVLYQWGVLHDGTTLYPGAITALCGVNKRLAVLSNSGKRAGPNASRITGMGFPERMFECVMTLGEALWQGIATGRVAHRILCPITRGPGDAETWVKGLDVVLTPDVAAADAVLLMGLPDRDADAAEQILAAAPLRLGMAVTSLGTTLAIKLLGPDRIDAPEIGLYSHRLGEGWLVGGTSNTGGACYCKLSIQGNLRL
ncbi:hypothetical protein [Gymnodinialimonas phycosphaerae]|uniref:hypothetical protein n=1 Tax=Gymnodinialimonas phycosphaerae TaxID=2841589 RepID=UPI002150C2ED|nr:hypothetical protein [Gymnodinialimonas phycosphaerae]